MATTTLATILTKCNRAGATVTPKPWSPGVLVSIAPRPFQVNCTYYNDFGNVMSTEAGKEHADEAVKAAKDLKSDASSTAEDMTEKTKDAAGKAADTAQDITEKAKQTAEDAWGSVKDTTQKIKDKVVGKADESKESVKQNAESVKRNMNMKNYN
ncbi:hypothetical protein RHSIM_Rhsim13G0042400 [Rhododendron simsii]|uniref:Uncharacterized protein n=1 Tax=Rhododendron simsii TaxID=118357 RepID=A0A834FY47_RHOSS|nr:hypothetical protein RHSIM_Rhsim13G0042400 [Rhododendron simsii]